MNHTIKIKDWGISRTHIANTSKEIADIVLDSGPGAFVNIDDLIIWDKALDGETTEAFWDFIGTLRAEEKIKN